jgi:phosphoribosylformylglycinamidine synthase subunit PurQ / glutaminase
MSQKPRASVIVFPGSNCDHDAFYALRKIMDFDARFVWHKDESLGDTDLIVLPGGFSYGDYLRCGAIARFSPIMKEIIKFARDGGTVLGICNGFQVLCEAGLLPGALVKNNHLQFVCKDVYIRVENAQTRFTGACSENEVLKIPVAHGEGNFIIDREGLEELGKNRQIVFRYCDSDGTVSESANPNGSLDNIAGIVNREGNVLGMMPHPERAMENLLGKCDGKKIFKSVQDRIVNLKKTIAAE